MGQNWQIPIHVWSIFEIIHDVWKGKIFLCDWVSKMYKLPHHTCNVHFKPKNFNSSIWPVVSCLRKELKLSLPYSIILIIIRKTYYEKAGWSRAFNQYTVVCEVDMIKCNIWSLYCIYQGYHLEVNVCVVTKALVRLVL